MAEYDPSRLKRCARCAELKPRDQFRRQASGRLYRNCTSCHRPNDASGRRDRAWWGSPDGKRECRRLKAEREGRTFRPGVPGPEPRQPTPPRADVAARRAWREWIAMAPEWWVAAYEAAKTERAASRKSIGGGGDAEALRASWRRAKHVKRLRWKEQTDGSLAREGWDALFNDARTCAYCGTPPTRKRPGRIRPTDATLEHVIPISRGGLHSRSNAVVACARCNFSKGSKTLDEWRGDEGVPVGSSRGLGNEGGEGAQSA